MVGVAVPKILVISLDNDIKIQKVFIITHIKSDPKQQV